MNAKFDVIMLVNNFRAHSLHMMMVIASLQGTIKNPGKNSLWSSTML